MTARRLTERWAFAGEESGRPFYARVLRLRHINPSSTLCFVFLEGATALAIILSLAELIPLWGIVLVPACVAAMVKINDLVAGAAVRDAATRSGDETGRRPMRPMRPFRTVGRAAVPGGAGADKKGRVYRSSPPDASTDHAERDESADEHRPSPADPAAHNGRDWPDEAAGRFGPRAEEDRATQIPLARHSTSVGNAPPADLHDTRAARTATARDWAADVFDTPAQRARHSATRRYE